MEYPKGILKTEICSSDSVIIYDKDIIIPTSELKLSIRNDGDRNNGFNKKSWFLNASYDWIIVKDINNVLCLVKMQKS